MGVVDTPSEFQALTMQLESWWLQSNPRSPDLKHKVTRKALWVDGWSNPPWVKAMLKSVTQGKLQPHVGYRTQGYHGSAQPNRSWLEHVTLGG